MDEQKNVAKIYNEYNCYLQSEQQMQYIYQQQQYLFCNTITRSAICKLRSQKLRLNRLKCNNNNCIFVHLKLFVMVLLLLFVIFVNIATVSGNMLRHISLPHHYTHLDIYKVNPRSSIKTLANIKMVTHKECSDEKDKAAHTKLPKFQRLSLTKKDLEWLMKSVTISNSNENYKQQKEQQLQVRQQVRQQVRHDHVKWPGMVNEDQLKVMKRKYEVEENEEKLFERPLNDLNINSTIIFKNNQTITDLLTDYLTNFFTKCFYQTSPELQFELKNFLVMNESNWPVMAMNIKNVHVINQTNVGMKNTLNTERPRNLASGRLLFLNGLKKILWPLFMGLQILKSLLIAMFIPALIGSLGKLFNKGISSGSAPLFIRPMEGPTDLDFRDNTINFDDDNKFLMQDAINNNKNHDPYSYHQAEASQLHGQYVQNSLDSLGGLTRLGLNERQHQLIQDSYFNALKGLGSASFKHSGSLATSSSSLFSSLSKNRPSSTAANINTFHSFQKVPDSSLLLSNYDPFYSPLLSRLDSVFAQLKLNSSNENCREKIICLMYSNPTKYAPYSNLVSAQLSRELNELRKPTVDNPDILRFFKYMKAAKDGQDGVDCESTFNECPEFKDFENPAMVTTYNDINKLVQARQML